MKRPGPATVKRPGAIRRIALGALLLAAAAAVAPPLGAQQDPNVARGFSPDKAYAVGEVDSVNLFNGNLLVALPLGQQYTPGGSLAYGLTLVYNSNVWDYEVRYVEVEVPPNTREPRRIALQPEEHNAGLGWTLSLGILRQAGDCATEWCYTDESGAEHAFYQTLHPGETDPSTVLYTRDGTYLRLQTSTPDGWKWVESPDGTVRRFELAGGEYRLRSITDPFGNTVTVTYPSALKWVISDEFRSHEVLFRTRYYVDEQPDGQPVLSTQRIVDKVRLAAVGGTVAEYLFSYEETSMLRSCYETDGEEVTSSYADVALLKAITQPDGSSWRMDYNRTCQEATLGGQTEPVPQLPGTMAQLVLPTRGEYRWTYEEIHYPARGDGINQGESTSIDITDTAAVASKTVLNANGQCETLGGVGCVWQWRHAASLDVRSVTVTMPTGAERVHWFDQDVLLDTNGHTGWEYGLPIHPGQSDASGRHLSEELYAGPAGASTKLRSTWLRYQRDKLVVTATFPHTWYDSNRRVDSRKTVYHDDGGRVATEDFTEFDGLGHHRRMTTGGTFGSGDVRTSFTDFNPGSGRYDVNVAANTVSGGYVPWPSSAAWILGTATRSWLQEGTTHLERQTCFDPATGFLERERTLAGSAPGAADLVVEHTPSARGNPMRTRWYGGDTQAVGTGSLCTLVLPATPAYQQQRSFWAGSLTHSWWVQASGTWMGYYDERYDVDTATGLPTRHRDPANVGTSFEHDAMGRLTWSKPDAGHGAWTQYQYSPAGPSSPPRVTVTERPNGSTSGVLALREVDFDSFGRVWRDKRQDAGGVLRTATSAWNTLGWRHSQTTHGSSQATVFRNHDAFGRPREVDTPDGRTVRLGYAGVRQVSRTVDVGGAAGLTPATRTEIHDRQGRLVQVQEPSGTGGAVVTTTYGYDAADRLRTVSTSHAGVTQGRAFTYDGRGFLLSEKHPEKGATGNGTVTYSSYDALGNAGRRMDGPFTLTYAYDRAGRLLEVREPTVGNRLWKAFTYATTNGGTDRRLGKLVVAERHNHVLHGGAPVDVLVRETYTYGGVGGSVSRRDTQAFLGGAPIESFTQSFTWTDLGDPATVTYPTCTYAQCPPPLDRTVAFGYSRGWLTAVPGFANPIRYNTNGLLYQVDHANGVTDTWVGDFSSMLRPRSIEAAGPGTWWSSGTYTYDGAGNVTAIGSARFTYDGVSRLVSAAIPTDPANSGPTAARSYTYDAFGNLKAIGGAGGRTVPVDSATNRLATATGVQTVAHDAAGNLTAWNGQSYHYDPFGMAWRVHTGVTENLHLYTADDERFWTYTAAGSRWTLRDLDGKVLREYSSGAAGWQVERDYVYRDGQLLAAVSPADGKTYHYHPDHLGSPRLVTNQNGQTEAYHAYWPYGEEATSGTQDDERMKFTGHERDLGLAWTTADDIDYHHARYFNFRLGRYLSPDLAPRPTLTAPGTWNLYLYAAANPLRFIDPRGEYIVGSMATLSVLQGALTEAGAPEEAKQLQIEQVPVTRSLFGIFKWTSTETRITSSGNLLKSGNEIANLIGSAIDTDTRLELTVAPNSDLAQYSGARTNPRSFESQNRIAIDLDPGLVQHARVPSRGGESAVPLGAAVVHELGHAFGYYHLRIPDRPRLLGFPGPTDRTAVMWENAYRRLAGFPLRAGH